jgi:hypothetical protein
MSEALGLSQLRERTLQKAAAARAKRNAHQRERRAEKAAARRADEVERLGEDTPSKRARKGEKSRPRVDIFDQVMGAFHKSDDEAPGMACSAYIHVHIPPPPIRVSGKVVKAPQVQIRKSGPLLFDTSVSHAVFLDQLATAVPCRRVALPQSQLRWRFEKPLKGDEKPLTGNSGFRAMIAALRERKKDRVIIIAMPPPQEVKESIVCPSQYKRATTTVSELSASHGIQARMTKSWRTRSSMPTMMRRRRMHCLCGCKWWSSCH